MLLGTRWTGARPAVQKKRDAATETFGGPTAVDHAEELPDPEISPEGRVSPDRHED